MGEQGQQSCEAAEAGREENEEGQLLLGIDGNLVERGQQLPVRTFYTYCIIVEFSMSNTSNFSVAINSRTFSWITKKIKQSSIDVCTKASNKYV